MKQLHLFVQWFICVSISLFLICWSIYIVETIKDLLAKGILDTDTRLVLVNALYFKGDWEKKFNSDYTTEVQFKINKVMVVKNSW